MLGFWSVRDANSGPGTKRVHINTTTIMELSPQNHNKNGLLGPNSIIVAYMDP